MKSFVFVKKQNPNVHITLHPVKKLSYLKLCLTNTLSDFDVRRLREMNFSLEAPYNTLMMDLFQLLSSPDVN